MTLEEQAKWLNQFDEREDRNWGVIHTKGEEFLGLLGPVHATVIAPKEIVFILLGQIKGIVARGEADHLGEEIFEVLLRLLASASGT
jgi:hypothetical protein